MNIFFLNMRRKTEKYSLAALSLLSSEICLKVQTKVDHSSKAAYSCRQWHLYPVVNGSKVEKHNNAWSPSNGNACFAILDCAELSDIPSAGKRGRIVVKVCQVWFYVHVCLICRVQREAEPFTQQQQINTRRQRAENNTLGSRAGQERRMDRSC